MTEKFLKLLNFAEAKQLIFQNEQLKEWISESDWDAAKYNGTRLVKILEKSDIISKKAAEVLKLDAKQMEFLASYLGSHFPTAKLG